MRYAIVIESGLNNYSAYVPDLPGCVATGKTLDIVRANMRGALEMHIGAMVEDGNLLPEYESFAETVDIEVPALVAP